MKRTFTLLALIGAFVCNLFAANPYDNTDTIFVAKDGSGEFTTIGEGIEACRAFMEYHKVIYVKKGRYCEKLVLPSWLTNVEICGEDPETTILTNNDHANKLVPGTRLIIGTFRTYTLRVDGDDIVIKNLTIENNAPRYGQAVALHTEGTRILFLNCRMLGNQDTVYTGSEEGRVLFKDCYIEGTTDFIFGPSTAWFENCEIRSKSDSFVTAASTAKGVKYGYVFNNCRLTAEPQVTKVYLGRPWRPYAYTLFMNCDLGKHILPIGWQDWGKKENRLTTTYLEYNNRGEGAATQQRADWTRQLTSKEAGEITMESVLQLSDWANKP